MFLGPKRNSPMRVGGQGVLADVVSPLRSSSRFFSPSSRPLAKQVPHHAGVLERHDLVAVDAVEERGLRSPVAQEGHHVQVVFGFIIEHFVVLVLGLGPGTWRRPSTDPLIPAFL